MDAVCACEAMRPSSFPPLMILFEFLHVNAACSLTDMESVSQNVREVLPRDRPLFVDRRFKSTALKIAVLQLWPG